MRIYDEKANYWIKISETPQYKVRKKKLRDAWIFLTLTMLLMPLALQVSLALLATFVSFFYLDEVPYDSNQ